MASLADGFVALPGGLGTLEELAEALSWAQLALHDKPCGVLDPTGYFEPLLAFLDRAVDEGFLATGHRELLVVARDLDGLLARFGAHRAAVGGWDLPG
jgi:uncharacterized protein (TIGR00730 family)